MKKWIAVTDDKIPRRVGNWFLAADEAEANTLAFPNHVQCLGDPDESEIERWARLQEDDKDAAVIDIAAYPAGPWWGWENVVDVIPPEGHPILVKNLTSAGKWHYACFMFNNVDDRGGCVGMMFTLIPGYDYGDYTPVREPFDFSRDNPKFKTGRRVFFMRDGVPTKGTVIGLGNDANFRISNPGMGEVQYLGAESLDGTLVVSTGPEEVDVYVICCDGEKSKSQLLYAAGDCFEFFPIFNLDDRVTFELHAQVIEGRVVGVPKDHETYVVKYGSRTTIKIHVTLLKAVAKTFELREPVSFTKNGEVFEGLISRVPEQGDMYQVRHCLTATVPDGMPAYTDVLSANLTRIWPPRRPHSVEELLSVIDTWKDTDFEDAIAASLADATGIPPTLFKDLGTAIDATCIPGISSEDLADMSDPVETKFIDGCALQPTTEIPEDPQAVESSRPLPPEPPTFELHEPVSFSKDGQTYDGIISKVPEMGGMYEVEYFPILAGPAKSIDVSGYSLGRVLVDDE